MPPLLPFLRGVRTFAEPCCGDGALVRHRALDRRAGTPRGQLLRRYRQHDVALDAREGGHAPDQ